MTTPKTAASRAGYPGGRRRTLGIILAGGRGERLHPLTRERSKPAVPFGGKYRIVDFVLSNFVNSNVFSLYILVQYKSQSLIDHLRHAWRASGVHEDHFILVVPPQMRWGDSWYRGTADAVYQNLNLIRDYGPSLVAIFGADHIYRMDISQMVEFHLDCEADVTVAALPVPLDRASGLGIVEADDDGRVLGFEEKPLEPKTMAGRPTHALGSMGNYVFNADLLVQTLIENARQDTDHDFGRTVIPSMVAHQRVFAYDFHANRIPGVRDYEEPGYWRDVGTIEAYWNAHMDLLGTEPRLDLANHLWPIMGAPYPGPPARIVHGDVTDSLVGEGSIVSGGRIRRSILGRGVRVEADVEIEESIVMDFTIVRRGSRLRRTIVDRFNTIEPGTWIGFDADVDAAHYHVDRSGIVVLGRGATRAL
ncbi:MAG: glucose-1-phosphate adenylyltransferase [Armatimonadota bacterium]|nr:glucose-1-phosphate adenylyltransferase [Armatimonadota bacterium]